MKGQKDICCRFTAIFNHQQVMFCPLKRFFSGELDTLLTTCPLRLNIIPCIHLNLDMRATRIELSSATSALDICVQFIIECLSKTATTVSQCLLDHQLRAFVFKFQSSFLQLAVKSCSTVAAGSLPSRPRVLALYRRILRSASGWKASSGDTSDTLREQTYIRGEVHALFKRNASVRDPAEIEVMSFSQ